MSCCFAHFRIARALRISNRSRGLRNFDRVAVAAFLSRGGAAVAATAREGQFRNPAGGGYGYYGRLCHALSLSLSLCGSTGSSHVSYLLRYVEIGERGETGGGPVRPSRDSFARCDFRFHLVDPNRHGTARNGMESHKLHLDKAPECGWQPSRSRGEAFRCSFRTFGKSVNMGYKTTLFIRKATLPS